MRTLFIALCFLAAADAEAQIAGHVLISEVYGGGGNAGSVYKNDFIELYNPTSSPVTMTNWSVQYASATGLFNNSTTFSGVIPANGFFLIQEGAGGGGTTNLPTPNASGTIAMSATTGKVALVSNGTLLGAGCAGAALIDLVSFGSGVSCSEGAGAAPTLSATTSVERKASATSTPASLAAGGTEAAAGNGWDSDLNSADFVVQPLAAINPQNSSSPTEGGAAGSTAFVAAGATPAEPATDGTFIITLNAAAPVGGVTVTYTLSGTASGGGIDYTDLSGGTITIPNGTSAGTITMDIVDDLIQEPARRSS